ncbi:MAG: GNAT family N-acetyltransferase, partial [Pseudomonadota bacterium]
VIDDYAHHPTAIRETLAALRRSSCKGKLLAVFEPRSATSRRSVFQRELADALAAADEVVVAKVYRGDSIPVEERLDSERLAADVRSLGTSARMIPDVDGIVSYVAERVTPGDCVAILSSGGFDGIHEKLLVRLGDPIMPARFEDMPHVRRILSSTGQPWEDMTDDRAGNVLVVATENGVVGCVAIEPYGEVGILRSLAVVPERRGGGLGWMLADCAVAQARAAGVRRLYILTSDASDFFAEKLGFQAIARRLVDPVIAASRHFQECGQDVAAMMLAL